jgi:hypothetical protein
MVHVRVQVPNRDAAVATRAIATEGLLHLVDIAHGHAPFDASPPGVRELYAAFRDLVNRIRLTADRLGLQREELTGAMDGDDITDFAAERERIALLLEPLEARLLDLNRKSIEARDHLTAARDRAGDATRLRDAAVAIDRLAALRFVAMRLGVSPAKALPAIAAMLSPAAHALVPLDEREGSVLFAALVPPHARARLDEAMRLTSTKTMALPRAIVELEPGQLAGELAEAERAAGDWHRSSASTN